MKQKRILIVLMAICAAATFGGCKKNVGTPEDNPVVEEEKTEEKTSEEARIIGFSCPDLSDPFYNVLKESVKSGIEAKGDHILVQDASNDAQKQEQQVEEMIDSGIDAIFYWPVDGNDSDEALSTLDEAGVPVINLGVKVKNTDLTKAFIAYDEHNAGGLCAENLKERKPDGGTVVLIEDPQDVSMNERMTGFEEKMANSGFEVVGRISAGKEQTDVENEMRRLFATQKNLDAVMCSDDKMAKEAVQILKEIGKNSVIVYSVGGSPEIKQMIADQENPMIGAGALSPINMGKIAVETVMAVLDGRDYEKKTYVESFFIDGENVEIYGTDGWQ